MNKKIYELSITILLNENTKFKLNENVIDSINSIIKDEDKQKPKKNKKILNIITIIKKNEATLNKNKKKENFRIIKKNRKKIN